MRKSRVLGGAAAAVFLGFLSVMPAYAKDEMIPEGIYVGEISLGGMTREEAEQTLEAHVEKLAEQTVTLQAGGAQAQTTAAELGYSWISREAVEEAASQLTGGNLIQQYMERKDLERDPVYLELGASVDGERLETFLKDSFQGLIGEPKNASITRENGSFVITPGESGQAVDLEAAQQALNQAIAEGTGQAVVEAPVVEKEPEITEEALSSIQDVLGSCSTDFSSSGAARSKNLAAGSSKINGTVLMPGETLSGYEKMQPFTTENGYYTAAAYENGQVVDSVGGGVCQIATTLYDAALQAELEITQRQNHSMIVTYVKPSLDAAIAGTYKDIKITNNYDTPIYVEAGISGRTLTFVIYGRETRPENRRVEYVSETLSVTDPGAPAEKVDHSLAPGTRKQVQSSHKGLRSRLWKVVYVDGAETERTLLHTDTYNASKAIVLVGPSAAAAGTTAAAESQPPAQAQESQLQESQGSEAPAQETTAAVVEGENGGPGVTAGAEESSASGVVSAGEAETAAPETAPSETAAPKTAAPVSEAPATSPVQTIPAAPEAERQE